MLWGKSSTAIGHRHQAMIARWTRGIALLLMLGVMTSAPLAESVKMWKWVDQDGKIHYSESRPPPQATHAVEKRIDPDRNVIQADNLAPLPPSSQQSSPLDPSAGEATVADDAGRHSEAAKGAATTTVSPAPPVVPPPPPPSPLPGGILNQR